MKTSNKILVTAFAAYLLYTIVSITVYVCQNNTARKETKTFFTRLEQTRIRTLIVTNGGSLTSRGYKKQALVLEAPFDAKRIRISGDTLYISGYPAIYGDLPYLENFVLDGTQQPTGRN